MRHPVLVLMALALLLSPRAVLAEKAAKGLVGAVTVEDVADILRSRGFRAEIRNTSGDRPMIVSATGGDRFLVFLTSCSAGLFKVCTSLQFYAGWRLRQAVTLERINDWNREYRFAKAYLDREGDPVLEMDVTVEGGSSRGNLEEWLALWETAVGVFVGHMRGTRS